MRTTVTHLLVSVERSARPPGRCRRGRLLWAFVRLGPRQFQQRDRLHGVQPGPTRVRPVPPHSHVRQAGPRQRNAVQRGHVPRPSGRRAPPEHRRKRPDCHVQAHDSDNDNDAISVKTNLRKNIYLVNYFSSFVLSKYVLIDFKTVV